MDEEKGLTAKERSILGMSFILGGVFLLLLSRKIAKK
jgi:hypothetical protein